MNVTPPHQGDRWARAIDRVLHGEGFSLAFQPIVDLQHAAVVGYEALSRFDGAADGIPASAPPVWFEEARRLGVLADLEARVVTKALDARDRLPPNTFLTVNISPYSINADPVSRVLLSPRGLHRIVVEITEDTAVDDYDALIESVAVLRARGAYLAIDDAGAGYASLSHILMLRPDFVKLDRTLVTGLAGDEAKLALVEMFGQFAGRIDAWVLAEGVETMSELSALTRLGVPLAQGFLIGRPGPDWSPLPQELREFMTIATEAAEARQTVHTFIEPWPFVEQGREVEGLRLAQEALEVDLPSYVALPVLDDFQRPVGLYPVTHPGPIRPVMVVKRSTPLSDAARRAITRPIARRFDPLVVVDEYGDYAGVVRLERVIEALTGNPEEFEALAAEAGVITDLATDAA